MTDLPGPRADALQARGSLVTGRRVLLGVLIMLGASALLFTLYCAGRVRDGERVMPGVHFEELNVSGLARPELVAQIRAWAAQRTAEKFPVSIEGKSLLFEPQSVALQVDANAEAARVLAVGRYSGIVRCAISTLSRSWWPAIVAAQPTSDRKRWSALEDAWEASAIQDGPFNGDISVAGSTVTALYPRAGMRLNRARAEQQLIHAFRSGSAAGSLATRQVSPRVTAAEVDRVASEARAMLSADVELATPDGARRLQVTPAQLASLLSVTLDASSEKLRLGCASAATHQLLEPHRAELEQAPQNARFVIDANDHVHVEPGHSGLALDDEAVAEALCAAAASNDRKGNLPLKPGIEPELSSEAAERAGVVGLVGSYTTRHACCQPRVENIHHIADLLDGTLVLPGATFSVNQRVGPRTVKNGFRPAPSIEDGDMVDTVGGGVSQFATTLFNALFYAGYDILERQPHSYWFTRYPMGYDATLSYPHPDIVFKNDTEACALIKTQYTDTSITVKIYGNNGGRRVRAEVSERQNVVPPPLEYIPNPRLEPDEEKTREGGMIGWTVTVKRTLSFPDGKIKEERRKVTYKPRARRVEVHPCRIPEGQPGHTGQRCPAPEPEAPPDGSSASDAGAK